MTTVEPIRNKNIIKKIELYLRTQNERNLLLFCLGLNSGLRISDILRLNISDVKNKAFIEIREKKTGKYKKFPINEKLKRMFKCYIKSRNENEPLFKTKYNNRMDRITAYKIIKEACKEVGIKENIGTHTMRKTFGYFHYKQFKDVVLLQKIFNH
ncbi:MAG: tyrosine-type recombinase/integrase [Candidatus Gastranaerophilaceae bacterium]